MGGILWRIQKWRERYDWLAFLPFRVWDFIKIDKGVDPCFWLHPTGLYKLACSISGIFIYNFK